MIFLCCDRNNKQNLRSRKRKKRDRSYENRVSQYLGLVKVLIKDLSRFQAQRNRKVEKSKWISL